MNKTIIYVVLGLVLLGGLFYFVMPKAEPAPNNVQQGAVKSFNLTVKNRQLVSGPATMNVTQGDSVKITVTSDEHNDIHLHGYDIEVEVMKDGWASLDFKADVAGGFPLELHEGDVEIAQLVVNPR